MKRRPTTSIVENFSSIPDPRLDRRKRHKPSDIFFITLCAAICGADDWASIEQFGKAKEKWFTTVLGLKHGIPSHDTFGRVFALIDTQRFSECFSRWVTDLSDLSDGEIIAIDGKCLRRSLDSASDKAAIDRVSAGATRNQLVLGQQRVDDKSNEITAIPKLLMQLNIAGAVVTLDAMRCQTAIAQQIVDQEADYLLSLKGNQGTLHQDVKLFFESANTCPPVGHTRYDGGHGRIETRIVRATSDIKWLTKGHPHWPKLTSIIAVTTIRECKDKTTQETRYFISSMDASNPERLGQIVRAHWGIENNLHWVLDYAFREDDQRMRSGNGDANMAVVRHIAINLVKAEKTVKLGVKNKRLNAGWDEDYLLKIVTGRPGVTKPKTQGFVKKDIFNAIALLNLLDEILNCLRGQMQLERQYHPERLLYPLKRVGAKDAGQFEQISWNEALDRPKYVDARLLEGKTQPMRALLGWELILGISKNPQPYLM